MNYLNSFHEPVIARGLVKDIHGLLDRPTRLMEVCGTHTVAIFRHGIRSLMPDGLDLVSGPGCPVCVTSQKDIDLAVAMADLPQVGIITFGDMIRVPGTKGSLRDAMARGADVRMVYSSLDAIRIAQAQTEKTFVFLGIGFETTAPLVAATIKKACELKVNNLKFLSMHKLLPPALLALFEGNQVDIQGLICPGHVSAIIGAMPYETVAKGKGVPCVITGFEPIDILQGIFMLLSQIRDGRSEVEIQYTRVVRPEGNLKAQRIMEEVFEPCDSEWRGLGVIPGSGLRIRDTFGEFDALNSIKVDVPDQCAISGCMCGDVLKGIVKPDACRMFGKACTPETPLGPCMVSSEGSCQAYYTYRETF